MGIIKMGCYFSLTYTPCGHEVWETEATDWVGAGYPHPKTGLKIPPERVIEMEQVVVKENDPANLYGVMYTMNILPDGTVLRLLND